MVKNGSTSNPNVDVAIIGGGPGGSTLGTLLRKYSPQLSVLILEKEKFPRHHVGESQLPPIGKVLHEMGVWDKVEAANFPVKIGATFRWGRTPELWDFDFLPPTEFRDEPRPARYIGQRWQTAFQVDRSVYDDILLRHAEELGCTVREQTQVTEILREGDRVTGLKLRDGSVVTARYYVDASGHIGILRRALGVDIDVPTRLQNIAIWDYWDNTEWAVRIGVGGTRIQVMSLPHGWLWFIPLGPTHTSLGFVCPAEYYRSSGRSAEDLYQDAINSEERVKALITNAKPRGELRTTKDWSFVSQRACGENWFLVGEAAGFADPILSAGLTLTHFGGRELAYIIGEIERGELDAAWMKQHYDETQRARVRQHIRFADYWYACNGQFTDLKEHCKAIADDSGLRLTPEAAFRWLAQGGFTYDIIDQAVIGSFDLSSIKQLTQMFAEGEANWQLNKYNVLRLNLRGATEQTVPFFSEGRIRPTQCLVRGQRRLPQAGMYETIISILAEVSDVGDIYRRFQKAFGGGHAQVAQVRMQHAVQLLEIMLNDGWIEGKLNRRKPMLQLSSPHDGRRIHMNRDAQR